MISKPGTDVILALDVMHLQYVSVEEETKGMNKTERSNSGPRIAPNLEGLKRTWTANKAQEAGCFQYDRMKRAIISGSGDN